jgi:DNA-binding HxlR family transcriptional regulator
MIFFAGFDPPRSGGRHTRDGLALVAHDGTDSEALVNFRWIMGILGCEIEIDRRWQTGAHGVSSSPRWTRTALAQEGRCAYGRQMARTIKKVRYSPNRKDRGHAPTSAAEGVEQALKVLEGRWKLVILFHLFDGKLVRFSELERAIPSISQKMLIQQLRQLESHGVVRRIVHHQVPPRVEYGLTDWGEALCPALDELLKWAASREDFKGASSSES